MEFQIDNFMKKFMGVLVAIIVVMVVLIPIISTVQTDIGDSIVKNNQVYGAYYVEPDTDYELDISADGWKVNGNAVIGDFRQGVFADSFVVQLNSPSDSSSFGYVYGKGESTPTYLYVGSGDEYVITFNNGTVNVIKVGEDVPVYTKSYDWAFAICSSNEENAWGTITRIGNNDAFVSDKNDVKLSGYYYTGVNKTFYSYSNGELYVDPNFDGKIKIDTELAEGTTDIYEITALEITVGEETFTPYLTLVPLSVEGHATSGTNYTILGVIPVFVLLGIVLAITRTFMPGSKDKSFAR